MWGGGSTEFLGAPWLACLVLGMTHPEDLTNGNNNNNGSYHCQMLMLLGALYDLSFLSLTRALQEECHQAHFPLPDSEAQKR